MNILLILLAAILILGPLVAIHEFGHFWVARRFGIKVLTFSIGFGPVVWKHIGKDGVQYQLAAIPLGGFVKMADEREGEVPPADLPRAFNRQSPWVRLAVVAAGPLINLALAVVLYWALFLPPQQTLSTKLGQVDSGSPAAVAGLQVGDTLLQVDGKAVRDWQAINYALVDHMGETGSLPIQYERGQQRTTTQIHFSNFLTTGSKDPLEQLGFYPWQPAVEPVLGKVIAGGAADRQGLKAGDRLLSINQEKITNWFDIARIVHANPEVALSIVVERKGTGAEPATKQLTLNVMPQAKRDEFGNRIGMLSIAPIVKPFKVPAEYQQTLQYGPIEAIPLAFKRTWDLSAMTVSAFGKMLTGKISVDNISGPVTIAKVAGHTAGIGVMAFFSFMALMSVSLGILNLLPIPVLDGGHMLYYLIEGVRGKPVPEAVQAWGMKIGLVMLGSLMVLALFNDFSRLLG